MGVKQTPKHNQEMRTKSLQVSSYLRTRIAALIMTLIVIAGQTWIAHAMNLHFAWMLPIVSGVMLITSILVYSGSHAKPSKSARALSIAVVVALPLINLVCIVWFIYDMLNPETVTISHQLLLAGFAMWIVNIGVFSLAYWELDSGGPEVRALVDVQPVFSNKSYPDFVFPQQAEENSSFVPNDWTPGFVDYLYLSITAATSFTPAATTPYSHMAKIMAGSEALVSLFILGSIVARAISL